MRITELTKGDRIPVILDHVKYVLIEHVGGNKMVSYSQSPLVVEADVPIKSAKFFGRFGVHDPVLLVPRHQIGSRTGGCP